MYKYCREFGCLLKIDALQSGIHYIHNSVVTYAFLPGYSCKVLVESRMVVLRQLSAHWFHIISIGAHQPWPFRLLACFYYSLLGPSCITAQTFLEEWNVKLKGNYELWTFSQCLFSSMVLDIHPVCILTL